jgi:hypothetical protein
MKRKVMIRKKRQGGLTIIKLINDETNKILFQVVFSRCYMDRLAVIGKLYGLNMNDKNDYGVTILKLLEESIQNEV